MNCQITDGGSRRTGLRLLSILAAVWLAVVLPPAVAVGEIQIEPASSANAELAGLARGIREELARSSFRTVALNLRITIGPEAFSEALTKDDGRPLIATHLSSTEFEAALGGRERPPHITAVFSNPDPIDQLTLARVLRGRSTIGVFDAHASHSLAARIAARGARAIPVAPGGKLNPLLRAAETLDVIIVLPDPDVFNQANITQAVRSLYQSRKVLIGHSASLTSVGALASVFVPSAAIARSVATVVGQYAAIGQVPAPTFVRDVDVSVNDRLARSLSFAVPDRNAILDAIRSADKETGAP